MKGLLHRLAARATGTTVPIYSDARLPFVAIGQRFDGAAGDVDAQQRPEDTAGGLDTQQRLAVGDEPAQSSLTATTRSAAREPAPSQTMPQSQSVLSTPLARADADAGPSAVAAFDAPSAKAAVPARLIEEASVAAPREAASRVARHSASSSRSTTPAKSSAYPSVIGEPSSLMPPVADRSKGPSGTTPAALRQLASQSPPSHMAVSEEPNEVHIHIGRIEVTAVHEAAAPRRRRQSAPTMTLDAYLAKRGRA